MNTIFYLETGTWSNKWAYCSHVPTVIEDRADIYAVVSQILFRTLQFNAMQGAGGSIISSSGIIVSHMEGQSRRTTSTSTTTTGCLNV